MMRVALFLLLTGLFSSGQGWQNNYDEPLNFKFPPGQSISYIMRFIWADVDTVFSHRWQFYCCRSSCISNNCQWTSHVNWFDETFFWNVPHHNVLVGAGSYHQDFYDNRRWR
ncbi:hemagglutinin/amebocyte aggregation factor-like isoform X3 [Labeo rohita]|uniref:hemagglutinin/amebocyte aggregation factor-like isoform X3 n=1 Tax=Labeo rohita TaxID=84645 RepID=UPI0021E1C1D9|nr:hemagglutinin/amebocyte aggregation factor-like isoform X3 [Labeo rohita]